MRLFVTTALLALAIGAAPVSAALSPAQLASVGASPPPGARLDPGLAAPDAHGRTWTIANLLAGRPAFVSFVDYTCTTLCGTDLELLSQAIARSRLDVSQFRIIVIGIDPKDQARSALVMERKEIPAALWPDTVLLLPKARVVERATAALGFHYVYDPDVDQFAHPAVVYLLAPDGTLLRTLSPFLLGSSDLAAMLNSPAPQTDLFQRVRLLCYAYDPATGVYTLRILTLLKIACFLTVLALTGAVIFLRRFRRRPA